MVERVSVYLVAVVQHMALGALMQDDRTIKAAAGSSSYRGNFQNRLAEGENDLDQAL